MGWGSRTTRCQRRARAEGGAVGGAGFGASIRSRYLSISMSRSKYPCVQMRVLGRPVCVGYWGTATGRAGAVRLRPGMGLQASARDGASSIGRRRRRVGVRLYYPVVDAESQPECLGIPQPPAAHSALQVQERMHHVRMGGWLGLTPHQGCSPGRGSGCARTKRLLRLGGGQG